MEINVNGQQFLPQRIFCIGRNYAEHIAELQNERPSAPVIFMKPASSLLAEGQVIPRPTHGRDLQFEAELVVLIGQSGANVAPEAALSLVAGVSLGLDLTLRDVQSRLKAKGLPWEVAKAFDGSAPVGAFVPPTAVGVLDDFRVQCLVNGEVRQEGHTAQMLFPVAELITAVSRVWALLPGDLIYTGTPAGVGPLNPGDEVVVTAVGLGSFGWVCG
ncbi:MAG: fumarylacetoacetate hydrolase family protein [Anaerolineales bacterium]|nr:fumarylacetoacetate hydrolase family protein [Anaerolineales bacterium]